jgi:hypothetical protein
MGVKQAFGEAGEPVSAVDFDFEALDRDSEDAGAEDLACLRREVVVQLFQMLTAGGANAKQIGRRVLLMAFLLGQSDCKTQRQLARRLGVTPEYVSRAIKSLKAEFPALAGPIRGRAEGKRSTPAQR